MNRTLVRALMTVAGLLAFSAPMLAHHGSRVSYDLSKQITMKGVVTEYQYQNPHIYIMYDVKDENGNVVHWGAETNSPVVQARFGWDRRTLKPGDEITGTLNPAKGGGSRGYLAKLVTADGKVTELGRPEN
jgi:Family of unknown function (DUF6152)